MGKEIERKFLVDNPAILSNLKPYLFKQAYLNSDKERTVRIRIEDSNAFLTIKSKTIGISRSEYEYPIPIDEANELLSLCETEPIEKYRYHVKAGKHHWEIDQFLGANQGLIIAEIELNVENENFTIPDWLGEEVSNDKRYFNSALSLKPFSSW